MRRLCPICDSLVNSSAANDVLCMQEIDEVVVQMVKDCGRKLRDSLALRPPAPHPPGMPAVVPGHLLIPQRLDRRAIQPTGTQQCLLLSFLLHQAPSDLALT